MRTILAGGECDEPGHEHSEGGKCKDRDCDVPPPSIEGQRADGGQDDRDRHAEEEARVQPH